MMAVLWLVAIILIDYATFHLWMKDCPLCRFVPVVIIQRFSKMMAVLWLVAIILMNNATFHLWMTISDAS